MARGRFGHRRHAGGNLSSLIAQLYREQQAAEDKSMFDAYQNGGKVADKPVTDQRMRDYIAKRRDGFSKDDPVYDQWNNQLFQLDFKIGEDKVALKYKEGKVGAGAVAAYYREQLHKIPQDSAFYREVAMRAADWAKAGASAARGRARGRLTKALEGKQNGVQKTWDSYSRLEAVLTDAAKRAGLIAGNQTLTDADASDLQTFLQSGAGGTGITFTDWRNATVAAYRAFDVQININKQLNRGTKELSGQKQKFLDQNLVRVNTVDDRAKYELARDAFEKAVGDAGGDPRAILAAAADYAGTLGQIRATAAKGGNLANENDPEFLGGLQNEIDALTKGKANGSSVYDLQSTSGEGTPTSDIESTAQAISKAQADVKALGNGIAYFGQTDFGSKLKVVYFPPGANLDPTGKNGLDDSFQQAVVSVNGVPTPVYLKGQPIKAVGLVDPNGHPVTTIPASLLGALAFGQDSTQRANGGNIPVDLLTPAQIAQLAGAGYQPTKSEQTVGYVFNNGGKTTFGVVQSDGSIKYTSSNPFGDLSTSKDGSFQVYAPSTSNAAGDAVPAPKTPTVNGPDLMTDDGITPKDLRNLATTADAQTAVQLNALADKKQSEADSERAYMARAQGKDARGEVSRFFETLTSTVKDVFGPALDILNNTDNKDQSPPGLPSINASPSIGAPPPLAGGTRGQINPDTGLLAPPSPTTNTSGAKSQGGADDLYKPPTPPKPDPNTHGGKSQGGYDDTYHPPVPPPPPSGNGHGGPRPS